MVQPGLYLQLHYAFVVLGGQFWVLEKWVLHINQVPLIGGVAVQDERHLGDHRGLQGQLSQRRCGALDGGPVLTEHTALEDRTEQRRTEKNREEENQ